MGFAFCILFVNLNHVSEYLFIGLLIIWLGAKLVSGSFVFEKTSLDVPILVFLGWVLLTVPFATDWTYSFEEWRKAIPRFLMFWFIVNVVKTELHVRAILAAFCLGIFVLSLAEVFYFFAQGGNAFSMTIRAGDLTGSSQWLSNYLVIGLPILWLGIVCQDRPVIRMGYIAALATALVALFVVHTRAAWVAVIAQGLFYGVFRFTRSWIVASLAVLLSVGLMVAFLALPGKQRELVSGNNFTDPYSMSIRFNTWDLAIDDIQESPIVGIGYGKHSFRFKHPELKEGFHKHVHNSFLSHAAQVGIPGFLFFVWIFGRILKQLGERIGRMPDDYEGNLNLAAILIIVGVIVRNLFDDMFLGTIAYLFWLLVGLSFSLHKITPLSQSDRV